MRLANDVVPFLENDMTDEKQGPDRLGKPDTGAHDKMHGDKLKSAGVPAHPGTGGAKENKPSEDEVSDDQVGGGV